jgi:hypothetical protein
MNAIQYFNIIVFQQLFVALHQITCLLNDLQLAF